MIDFRFCLYFTLYANRYNHNKRVKMGHYTQMVWADSYLIGCAANQYKSNHEKRPYEAITYCNYGPAGNLAGYDDDGKIIGQAVYMIGKKPASECPTGTKANPKTGLCVKLQQNKRKI